MSPRSRLFGGETGTEIYLRLSVEALRVLRPGGWLLLELGYNSEERVRAMLDGRWTNVQSGPDLAGIPRVLAARKV